MNTPDPIQTEEQPTAMEIAQFTLQLLRQRLASSTDGPGEGTGNLYLLHSAIFSLEWELAHMFDEETGEYLGDDAQLPTPPLPAAIAPAEAQVLTGTFDFEGVTLSKARGPMGGHRIIARDALAYQCRTDPGSMVSQYGGSKRVYIMMAAIIDLMPWHYFPCAQLGRNDGNILVAPEVPLTVAEMQLWKDNWYFFHFRGAGLFGARRNKQGAASSNRMIMNLHLPVAERTPLPGVRIYTMTNHPDWVMEEMRELMNTNLLIDRYYRTAVNTLERIDGGIWPRVPGYRAPDEMGGTHSQEWYRSVGERESGENWPDFF